MRTVRIRLFRPLASLPLGLVGLVPAPHAAVAQELVQAGPAIERAMERHGVPGVSVSLVRDCRIAESRSWGVRGPLSRESLEPDDRIQAASLGKPVAALAILSRAGRDARLQMDDPLGEAGERLGITPADAARKVTMRQMLSHTTGLGNSPFPGTLDLAFTPGSQFRYSGLGYTALQNHVEQVTGQPIEAIVRQEVFEPFGMRSSSYTDLRSPVIGQVRGRTLLSFGVVILTGLALPVLLVMALVRRRRTGRWQLRPVDVLVGASVGVFGASLVFVKFMGATSLVTAVPLLGLIALAAYLGAKLAVRRVGRRGSAMIGAVLGGAAAVAALWGASVPIRSSLAGANGNIAYTLMTTTPDLARFAINVMRPPSPQAEAAAAAFRRPAVRIDDAKSWTSGIGVYKHAGRTFLWQWGSNPGFSGLLVMEPDRCDAVVVLTNGENGALVGREIVKSLLGADTSWRA